MKINKKLPVRRIQMRKFLKPSLMLISIQLFLSTAIWAQDQGTTKTTEVKLMSCTDPQFVLDNSNKLQIDFNNPITGRNPNNRIVKAENGSYRLIYKEQSEPSSLHLKFPSGTTKATAREARRKAAIEDQVVTIIDAVTKKNNSQPFLGLTQPEKEPLECAIVVPTYQSSDILFEVTAPDGAAKADITTNLKLTAGPRESLYLTGDVPLTSIKQIRKENGVLSLKETPASFYLGMNYRLYGDYLSGYQASSHRDNISAKLMFKVSAKPTESMGFGLSYKMAMGELFVARMRTINTDADGSALGGNTFGWVVGLSFDLKDNLPNWLK